MSPRNVTGQPNDGCKPPRTPKAVADIMPDSQGVMWREVHIEFRHIHSELAALDECCQ
jgi:hypothetical protein